MIKLKKPLMKQGEKTYQYNRVQAVKILRGIAKSVAQMDDLQLMTVDMKANWHPKFDSPANRKLIGVKTIITIERGFNL